MATRYQYENAQGEIGVISSVTDSFCSSCSRARISAEGTLYTCLFATEGTNLRELLRSGEDDETITQCISNVWGNRKDRYSDERNEQTMEKGNTQKLKCHISVVRQNSVVLVSAVRMGIINRKIGKIMPDFSVYYAQSRHFSRLFLNEVCFFNHHRFVDGFTHIIKVSAAMDTAVSASISTPVLPLHFTVA